MESSTSARPRTLATLGAFFFRHRSWVLPGAMIALWIAFRPTYPRGSASLDAWLDIAGIAVILTGQGLRILTIGLAYIIRGGRDRKVYAEGLVTEGIFSHCRNPMYLGNMLVYLGLLIVFNSPAAYLIGVPFYLLVYTSIVAAEEEFLLGKFGTEYVEYCKRVGRWLPKLRGLRRTVRGMTFSWARVVLKEHGSTYAWLNCLLALLAYESFANASGQNAHTRLVAVAWTWVAVTALWGVARYLKVTDKLRD